MSDPRETVDVTEIGYRAETFAHDGSIVYDPTQPNGSAQVGLALTFTGDKQVGLVDDGQAVDAKLIDVGPDGFCTAQTKGYAPLPGGDGASLTRSKKIVGDQGAGAAKGYIREVNTAVAAELGVAHCKIIDPSTTTAVIVDLG